MDLHDHAPEVAIVGAGLMGRWHAYTARRCGARIVAVADPDTRRAAMLSGGAPVFADAHQMMDAMSCDIVHLCSPTATHGALLRAAIDRGVHVFAEKPLASDGAETRAILQAARAADRYVCPVHQYAFQSGIEGILAARDRIGDTVLVELDFYSAGADGREPADFPGVAADILPHPLSILQRLFPGVHLSAEGWSISAPAPGTFTLAGSLGGTLVRITLSLTARPTAASLRLAGTRGAYAADLFHDYRIFRDGAATRLTKMTRPLRDGAGHLFAASVNLGRRALRRETAYPGLRNLTDRVYDTAQGRGPQPISSDQCIDIADLRDRFLAVAAADPKTPARGSLGA